MKRLLKGMLKAVWRWTFPLRRPFLRKLRLFFADCFQPAERLMADEANMLMNHVVRELVRLQRQVDALQASIEELSSPRDAIAGEIGPDEVRRFKAG